MVASTFIVLGHDVSRLVVWSAVVDAGTMVWLCLTIQDELSLAWVWMAGMATSLCEGGGLWGIGRM